MKNDKIRFLFCALFFIVLAMITFRCVFGENMVFSASDLNIGRLAFKKNYLPESLTGYYTANQVMGVSGSQFILFTVLLALMPLTVFANVIYGMILVVSSLAMVWFLRIWNRSWLASVFGALVAFWFNSIMLAAGGHAYKMEVLAFATLSLCLVEKAVRVSSNRRAIGYSILAGICVGIMMIEQQDVALIDGAFVGFYALFRLIQQHRRAAFRWASILLPIAVVSLLLSGSTVLNSYKYNIAGEASVQSGGQKKWDFITQWSLVPGEWPDFIALGWGGWGSGNPEGPYWGKIGQSADWDASTGQGMRNFKITSKYLGMIPFLFGTFALLWALRNRKARDGSFILFWSIAGLTAFWLSFGKYSLLYKIFYHLPLIGNIRDQSKFLDIFQVCLGIVAAFGLDQLVLARNEDKNEKRSVKWFWVASSVLGIIMLLAALRFWISPDGRTRAFSEMGFSSYADLMVRNMLTAWLHAGVLTLLSAGLIFVVWKWRKLAKWVPLAFVVMLVSDSLILTSHYFNAQDITSLKQGNDVVNFIKSNQGDERTVFVDAGGIYNQWLASDGPYHGLNLFNIWQMPRMPTEYQNYLNVVGRNQIRLWQLSAVKYIAAPASIMQQFQQNPELGSMFNPVLNYRIPTAQGMRPDVLLEFKGSIPRFALFQNWQSVPLAKHCETLVSPQHNPLTTVLVDASAGVEDNQVNTAFEPLTGKTTKRNAVVEVDTPASAILRFSQRFQSNWKVLVDGQPAKLLRLDYLSMGVEVPAGIHTVEFQCVKATSKVIFKTAVLVLSLAGAMFLFFGSGNKAKDAG